MRWITRASAPDHARHRPFTDNGSATPYVFRADHARRRRDAPCLRVQPDHSEPAPHGRR
ncbi:hypothetical protein SBD_3349 [Streptomyces bottropensis ATCC 25435]|uniref:Uncharacterized protein n=1 Tax=Streptomyces bottropensis ATCC 25435 TaxID=1054862 RepID=M3EI80_9ACTN|nr:hypothetical protein SBD_3349 [Streptomyces bottropensis ATCC 25435]